MRSGFPLDAVLVGNTEKLTLALVVVKILLEIKRVLLEVALPWETTEFTLDEAAVMHEPEGVGTNAPDEETAAEFDAGRFFDGNKDKLFFPWEGIWHKYEK